MEILIRINEYLGNFDNIVGALGLIVAIIGIIVGGIGCKNIVNANKIVKNMVSTNGNNQLAENIVNKGVSPEIAGYIAEEKTKEQIVKSTKTADAMELLKNSHYSLTLFWFGTQEEYDELVKNDKTYRNVMYVIL